ncbi:MAG TPA: hypothetical protein DCZ54_01145 [Candidatus Vogelbacteria bacterium]|nr:hypothetical protein [Candidatus Vogelbacteria bacterium]
MGTIIVSDEDLAKVGELKDDELEETHTPVQRNDERQIAWLQLAAFVFGWGTIAVMAAVTFLNPVVQRNLAAVGDSFLQSLWVFHAALRS